MVVTKNPGPEDRGIRYYRPKPYLFIGPAQSGTDKPAATPASPSATHTPGTLSPANPSSHRAVAEQSDQNITVLGGQQSGSTHLTSNLHLAEDAPPVKTSIPVTIRLEYLPDYNEEYSIRVTPGLGQAALNVSLQNGWNLNSVDAKTDQRYAEIIGSVASLVGAVNPAKHLTLAEAESNVPLGYYEGVLATNECGGKELIGWRYVGFMPCVTCPVKACVYRGEVTCDDDQLYGLVFERGTLQMKSMRSLKTGTRAGLNCPCYRGSNPANTNPPTNDDVEHSPNDEVMP